MNYNFIIFPSDIVGFKSKCLFSPCYDLLTSHFEVYNEFPKTIHQTKKILYTPKDLFLLIPIDIISKLKIFIFYEILDFVKISYPVSISIHDITSSKYVFSSFYSTLKNISFNTLTFLYLSDNFILFLYKQFFIYCLFYLFYFSILSFFIYNNTLLLLPF